MYSLAKCDKSSENVPLYKKLFTHARRPPTSPARKFGQIENIFNDILSSQEKYDLTFYAHRSEMICIWILIYIASKRSIQWTNRRFCPLLVYLGGLLSRARKSQKIYEIWLAELPDQQNYKRPLVAYDQTTEKTTQATAKQLLINYFSRMQEIRWFEPSCAFCLLPHALGIDIIMISRSVLAQW